MPRAPRVPSPTLIYAMLDPRNGELFYIGKTTNTRFRWEGHVRDRRNCERTRRIQQILGNGFSPMMVQLETIPAGDPWAHREKYWIAFAREQGWPICNQSAGGEGAEVGAKKARRKRTYNNEASRRSKQRRGGDLE